LYTNLISHFVSASGDGSRSDPLAWSYFRKFMIRLLWTPSLYNLCPIPWPRYWTARSSRLSTTYGRMSYTCLGKFMRDNVIAAFSLFSVVIFETYVNHMIALIGYYTLNLRQKVMNCACHQNFWQ